MKIGYYVQGAMDEAFVWGLAKRWCPRADLAEGFFRGSSQESFRREIRKALIDLRDAQGCDILVVLTDSDANPWREVKRRESEKIPNECLHMCVFGVAERNIECWLSTDRRQLASCLECSPEEIPTEDPSGFVQRRFALSDPANAQNRVRDFVADAGLKAWINDSESFAMFYDDVRDLAARCNCKLPNERDIASP